jgi:hypothetical protein
MKQPLSFAAIALMLLGCATPNSGASRTASTPGHGAISLSVQPNPIVARKVSGTTYEFPFDVAVRETGGRGVTISSVSVDVYALGGVRVGSDSYDAARIASLGYATSIPGNGELRYHFAPRKDVTDDRLFGGVYGEVRVSASDETGTPASASTRVTVTR